MNTYIKVSLPTGRDIFLNANQITSVCQDPISPTKIEIYMADGIRYNFVGTVESVLKIVEAKAIALK